MTERDDRDLTRRIERSAELLDTDPAAAPTAAFRARARAALLGAQRNYAGGTARLPRRLAAAGVATLLFGMIAMPAMAGPGGMAGSVARSLREAIGLNTAPLSTVAVTEETEDTGTPVPDATPVVADDHPDNHGAEVSEVARATPEPGQNHGEMVREVARDNHGLSVAASKRGDDDEAEVEHEVATGGEAGNHGQVVSEVARDNEGGHGQEVSEVAQSTEPGPEHGQVVSEAARDNHGQEVSEVAKNKGAGDTDDVSGEDDEDEDNGKKSGE